MALHKYLKIILPTFFYQFFKKIYHIFRYFNLIKKNYSTNNNIFFGDNKTGEFLKNKILKSKIYLEFGSGNTTIFAAENKINYYSVESDRNFYFYMKKKLCKNIFFYSLGFVEFYSYPLFKLSIFKKYYQKKAKKYASNIFHKLNKDLIFPDLILVDGRYRVLCMLNIFNYLKKNNLYKTCVILDDYENRKYYQVLENFFEINLFGRLGVCYLKNTVLTTDNLIERFSIDPR